ncbi:MAG TPA: hypothetical protein VGE26_05770 [Sphingobacteriaceae bacterium]
MKRLFYIFFSGILTVSSCQSDKKEAKDRQAPQAETPDVTAEAAKAPRLPWTAVANPESGKLELKEAPNSGSDLSAREVIEAANIKYPKIRLELQNIKGSTAFVKIDDATYLTQQMGSAGAQAYLAEITYSLTQVGSIESVNFEFTEGDHASPGVFTRESFAGFN